MTLCTCPYLAALDSLKTDIEALVTRYHDQPGNPNVSWKYAQKIMDLFLGEPIFGYALPLFRTLQKYHQDLPSGLLDKDASALLAMLKSDSSAYAAQKRNRSLIMDSVYPCPTHN